MLINISLNELACLKLISSHVKLTNTKEKWNRLNLLINITKWVFINVKKLTKMLSLKLSLNYKLKSNCLALHNFGNQSHGFQVPKCFKGTSSCWVSRETHSDTESLKDIQRVFWDISLNRPVYFALILDVVGSLVGSSCLDQNSCVWAKVCKNTGE